MAELQPERDDHASPEYYLDQAMASFTEALGLVEGDDHTRGVLLHDIGSVHQQAGRSAEALEHYREAAVAKRGGEDLAGLAITLEVLTSSLIDAGQVDEAGERADELGEVLGRGEFGLTRAEHAVRWHELGNLYQRLADRGAPLANTQALDAYSWALDMLDREADPVFYSCVQLDLGDVHLAAGRLWEAAESFDGAAHVLRSRDQPQLLVSALIRLGRARQGLAARAARPRPTPEPAPDTRAEDQAEVHEAAAAH